MSILEFILHLVCILLILASLAAFSFDQLWIGLGIVLGVFVIEMTICNVKCCYQRYRNNRIHEALEDPEQTTGASDLEANERSRLHSHQQIPSHGSKVPGKPNVSYGTGNQTWITPHGPYSPDFRSFDKSFETKQAALITSDLHLSCGDHCESHMFSFDSQFDSAEEKLMESVDSDENSICVSGNWKYQHQGSAKGYNGKRQEQYSKPSPFSKQSRFLSFNSSGVISAISETV